MRGESLQSCDAHCETSDKGRYAILRERTLGSLSDVCAADNLLRPDVMLVDHQLFTITPVEFTFPDDPGIMKAETVKYQKYALPLANAPRPQLNGRTYSYTPLKIFVVGIFGSVPPCTETALTALGIPADGAVAVMRAVVKHLAEATALIVRMRLAYAGKHRPT